MDDVEDVSLLPLVTDELSVFDDENLVDVGSADVSVMPVFVLKLGDDEIVTYDVENELLTVLVAVVGVAVGMDDKTEEEELVVSLSPPFAPPPPSTFFLVVDDDTDDDLSREDDNDELSSLEINDDVVYFKLVVDAENFVSVTAIVVPVDLPGEKVIVFGIVGLIVVEAANSEEETEEEVPEEELVVNSEDTELC